jgi:hypothetical protein
LGAAPRETLPFLKTQLQPVAGVDAQRIKQLIKDLDSDEFQIREKAAAELLRQGAGAESALRRALDEPVSVEVQRRVQGILEKLAGTSMSPARLRELRVVEVLEQIGSADARAILSSLAGGASEARLTLDARAALRRLSRDSGK